MATNLNNVLRHIHNLVAPPGGSQTDGELLSRFVATRDEASFAALVRRHGPMVLAVCRRLLRHEQDAEDCFQATFLVLARKAATVKRESVGSWLYAVAYRTSLEARAVNARRRKREKQVEDMPHPEVMPSEAQDWRPWLDRELNRLPEKYRAAIVACDLEGRSRKEAARLLDLTEGTLSSRLARGHRLLAQRLAPYGLSLPGAAVAAALCESAAAAHVPAALVSATTKIAVLVAAGELSAVSATSAILMKGVLKSMFLTKLKLMVGAVMVVTVLGASGLVYRAAGQPASPTEKRSDGKPKSELERLRHENELLKLNLEVVLEKVRAQEAELRALRRDSKAKLPELQKMEELQAAKELRREVQRATKDLRWKVKEKEKKDGEKKGGQSSPSGARQSSIEDLWQDMEKLSDLLNKLDTARSDLFMWKERAAWSKRMSQPGREYVTVSQAKADESRRKTAELTMLETFRKVRKAIDDLDRALRQLRSDERQLYFPPDDD
jgi:RNA polymerase sigma factor (sigma-70 family)